MRNDLAYPAMLTFLPPGLLGLVVTSLAAAYMSTISTSLNWGSSILVNDVYRRFMNPRASDRRVVWVGRLCTLVLLVLACIVAFSLESALEVFNVLLQIGPERDCSTFCAGFGGASTPLRNWWRWRRPSPSRSWFQWWVPTSTVGSSSWPVSRSPRSAGFLARTSARRTDKAKLEAFYLKIRPGGPGWNPVRRSATREREIPAAPSLAKPVAAAFLGSAGIYSILFMTGSALYGRPVEAGAYGIAGLVALYTIRRLRAWRAHE